MLSVLLAADKKKKKRPNEVEKRSEQAGSGYSCQSTNASDCLFIYIYRLRGVWIGTFVCLACNLNFIVMLLASLHLD